MNSGGRGFKAHPRHQSDALKNEVVAMEINFVKEKETKNTVRFMEVPEEGKPPVVSTLYLQKWFIGNAEKVKVTVEKL